MDRFTRLGSRAVTLAAAATAVAVLAGCSPGTAGPTDAVSASAVAAAATGTPGTGSGGSVKACDLLTAKIAARTTGTPTKRTRDAQPNPHESQCGYSGRRSFVNVLAGDCSFVKQFNSFPGATKVRGVGDSAELNATGLLACKGAVGVVVTVGIVGTYVGSAADSVEKRQAALEKQVAIAVLGRSG